MEPVQRLKDSITWLGGALAAIAALFYAAGYLSFHAHLTMLGLGQVVDLPHDQMLLEGARFFFTITSQLLNTGLALGLAVVAMAVVFGLAAEVGPVRRAWRRLKSVAAESYRRLDTERPGLVGTLVMITVVWLLYFHAKNFFYPLLQIGQIDGLLFGSGGAPASDCRALIPDGVDPLESKVVAAWLRQGGHCTQFLLTDYRRLLDGYFWLLLAMGALTALRAHIGGRLSVQTCWVLLSGYTIIYTLLLPIGFGVLVRAAVYPVANLEIKGGPALRGDLLARDDKTLLIWSPSERRAVWYPRDAVSSLFVTGQESLFGNPEGVAK
jgi:hypothetical protein